MKSSSLNELYSRNPKTVTYVLSQSRLWHLKLIVPREKTVNLYILPKKCQRMETKMSVLVIQNLNAACWIFIKVVCHIGIKDFSFRNLNVL